MPLQLGPILLLLLLFLPHLLLALRLLLLLLLLRRTDPWTLLLPRQGRALIPGDAITTMLAVTASAWLSFRDRIKSGRACLSAANVRSSAVARAGNVGGPGAWVSITALPAITLGVPALPAITLRVLRLPAITLGVLRLPAITLGVAGPRAARLCVLAGRVTRVSVLVRRVARTGGVPALPAAWIGIALRLRRRLTGTFPRRHFALA